MLEHWGIVGSDRVVALPSPRPRLLGVWATVCHYPNARRNITHSKTGMLGAEMSEQEGGFQTLPPVRSTCSGRLANTANTHRHTCKQA